MSLQTLVGSKESKFLEQFNTNVFNSERIHLSNLSSFSMLRLFPVNLNLSIFAYKEKKLYVLNSVPKNFLRIPSLSCDFSLRVLYKNKMIAIIRKDLHRTLSVRRL